MVDRCICFSKSFSALKTLAAQNGVRTLTELQSHAEFGVRCGLCKPYVQRMLSTGQTDFAVMPAPLHPFEDPGLFPDSACDSACD